ncbi:FYVE-domain-containing protein [Jaminaea rosea]|uniref:FYVE-domain-containing protein n=1 Tax=Jaminaea rosea TaxID=1569628 RepID=A0A316UNA4_9BASI|nr:FYVE-domain-containing protein [Jaminaea rosea]PWN26434.1 FYVE-domain-containing protein [Jaminaea rosea]
MNASSNGHLPIVRFLTTKHHADPFQRNSAGETAYDVAAASFEIFICQVLESYEAERWSALRFASAAGATQQRSYNPLYLHTTVPVLIYQNERLDTRLSALATNGGRPRWSGSGAGRPHKPDRRAPGTLPPGPLSSSLARHTPMRREDVDLPRRSQPYKLRLPTKSQSRAAAIAAQHRQRANGEDFSTTPTPESILEQQRRGSVSSSVREQDEPSHFWLCDWQLDRTHPQADHVDGWQYAQSFDAAEDRWSAQVPPPLTRLLEGKGLGSAVTRAISGGHLPGPGQSSVLGDSNGDSEATPTGWVRRRRWVRVMRRRLDIDFGDELEAAELSDHSVEATQLHVDLSSTTTRTAQEAAQIECDELGADADYVAKAIALAGAKEGATPADAMGDLSPQALQSRSVRLELAINELRGSAFDDQDVERRTRAEDLLKEFTLQVSQLRQAAGMGEGDDANDDEEEEDDDEEFIYPNSFKDTQSTITRIAGASQAGNLATNRPAIGPRVNSSYSVFGNTTPVAPPSEAGATAKTASNHRSADLARATEFRVPTNEAPATLPIHQHPTLREATLIPNWEPDEDAADCRNCGKRFTFFTRKHHCRRCGRIFCADCSSHRAQLSADELVIDPGVPEMFFAESSMGISRICAGCHAERQLPPALRNTRGGADLMLRSAAQERGGPSTADAAEGYGATTTAFSSSVSSRASELNECPVCNVTLAQFGCQQDQEEHLRICLENGGGGSVQGGRYLVYRLQEDSPIISKECVICFEELLAGQAVARLPCLCFFHEPCVASWLGRGKSCPTHAR